MNGVETPPLVNLQEIAEIELFILRRMKEYTLGDHASVFKGSGFNFVGSRDWQPGDRMSHIDWAQSSMTNFSPLVTREFEQDSTATVLAVADASMSTRCGAAGVPIAAAIARSIAAVGLSAVFFQDQFGQAAGLPVDISLRPRLQGAIAVGTEWQCRLQLPRLARLQQNLRLDMRHRHRAPHAIFAAFQRAHRRRRMKAGLDVAGEVALVVDVAGGAMRALRQAV